MHARLIAHHLWRPAEALVTDAKCFRVPSHRKARANDRRVERLAHFADVTATTKSATADRAIIHVPPRPRQTTAIAHCKVKRLRNGRAPRLKHIEVVFGSIVFRHSCFIVTLFTVIGSTAEGKFHVAGLDYLWVRLLICVIGAADLRHVLFVVQLAATPHLSLHSGELFLQLLDQILLLEHVSKTAVSLPCGYNLVEVVLFGTPLSVHFLPVFV